MIPDFVEELRWRGMLHDLMPGTEELLKNQRPVSGYIGFDPTAESLHVGSLAQIMTLRLFQQAGHKPIALVGGATGMVGDPSGKSQERNLLDEATLEKNLKGIKKQLQKFLDFDCGPSSAEIVNNYDWFKDYKFLDFIRDVGKHITVNYMMAKDSVKRRISGEEREGMSFTEFTYQMVQGYDFFHLWKNAGVKVQMGGSDQWGNITTGTELIRRMAGGEAFALTTKLINKADGSKFGKTETGNVWLDPELTSPYQFYQFWLNVSDADAELFIRVFTSLSKEEVTTLAAAHQEAPHLRILQKRLAEEVTTLVHSKEDCLASVRASEILFGKSTKETLSMLSERDFLDVFNGVPVFEIATNHFSAGISVVSALTEQAAVFPSKAELRRTLKENALSLNKEKETDEARLLTEKDLLNKRYVLVQKGKKQYFILKAV